MTQPIIHDYLTQIFVKHYKMQPKPAAQEALRLLEIIDLYKMELIMAPWQMPEPVPVGTQAGPRDAWLDAVRAMEAAADREPWLALEIQ